jgi:hypothetical protein
LTSSKAAARAFQLACVARSAIGSLAASARICASSAMVALCCGVEGWGFALCSFSIPAHLERVLYGSSPIEREVSLNLLPSNVTLLKGLCERFVCAVRALLSAA